MEDMKKKLTELAKANEELVNKNTELLGKLKKADNQIIELEKERRADKNEINALKKQLHKGANHAQTKQIICVTEEKQEEEDRSKPVEEEEYNCREEQPGTEEVRVEISLRTPNKYCAFFIFLRITCVFSFVQFFKQVAEPVPLRKIFPEDDEPVTTDVNLSKLDKLVAQAVEMAEKKMNEETSLKNKEQQAGELKKYVKQKGSKQTVETGSIERDINLKKRGAQKRKEEE